MSNEFKPYVPADKITPELTVTSIIMGLILSVVFGAANAYLGLRVGMTVSASIPAAVLSMAIIRSFLKKNSILESNMVQTIGSAGESLAAGAIFTMPALFLWANEGVMDRPNLISVTIIALIGGLLGVLFMVPLRNALIVSEHGVLPYPEGTACAEVLLAGEEGGADASSVFIGLGAAAGFKFLVDGIKVIPGVITAKVDALKTEFSAEVYPALIAVGYICGPKIATYMFVGGILGWFVFIPAIVLFGDNTVIYPGTVTIGEIYAGSGAGAIWSSYIRYIGAGAVAAAGIISLVKSFPLIIKAFVDAMKGVKNSAVTEKNRTNRDLDMRFILIAILVLIMLIWLVPAIPVTLVGAIIVVIFGFFFATVSSRMVGLVGSSNNPVSGMTIATLLVATYFLKLTGDVGAHGMQGAIAIGSIICIVAAIAGDTSQDLKTGYILGATPRTQQIGELMGTFISAISIGGVLILMDKAYGYGSAALPAPQATLMKMIIEGVMDGNLPWALIFIGAFVAIGVELLGIPSLAVAIGLYLPLELSATIFAGGLVRKYVDKNTGEKQNDAGKGVLFCSGMIAGEGIVGILLALFAIFGISEKIDLSGVINTGTIGGIILFVIMIAVVAKVALPKKSK